MTAQTMLVAAISQQAVFVALLFMDHNGVRLVWEPVVLCYCEFYHNLYHFAK